MLKLSHQFSKLFSSDQVSTTRSKKHKRSSSYHANAVVTGAGSGIGQAFALELAQRGGQVICTDINTAAAQATCDQIIDQGGQAWAMACDVSKLSEVQKLADFAQLCFGESANLIINNAGVGVGGQPIGEVSIDDWRWIVDVNMWGTVHGCHVFTPLLRQLGHGGIINVCSTASFSAAPLMGPYNLTKSSVLTLSETLAAELAGSHIKVTALCPAFVKTNIFTTGRLTTESTKLSIKLMQWIGIPPSQLVKKTLDSFDQGALYVMPQFSTQVLWSLKRAIPRTYTRSTGLLHQLSTRFLLKKDI